jgi:hypothetical protein
VLYFLFTFLTKSHSLPLWHASHSSHNLLFQRLVSSHQYFDNMTYKDIFDFNPLTAIFLSGYATHLYILMCFNQQNLSNIQVPTELLSCSKKRIKRWNLLFINFCMSQYQSYLLAHEKEVLQATSKSKGVDLTNPFYVHAQLLIKASQKMIAASSKSAPHNTDAPDE